MKYLTVPFTFTGEVTIECTEQEYESNDSTILHERATVALEDQIGGIYDLEFDGFDMCDAEWVDE